MARNLSEYNKFVVEEKKNNPNKTFKEIGADWRKKKGKATTKKVKAEEAFLNFLSIRKKNVKYSCFQRNFA